MNTSDSPNDELNLPAEEDATPIDTQRVSRLSSPAAADDVVAEYEQRYRPRDAEFRRDSGAASTPAGLNDEKRKNDMPLAATMDRIRAGGERMWGDLKRKDLPRSYSTYDLTSDEKLWAAVAHASVWLTLLGGVVTGGTLVPLSIFVPLVIYFMFRKQSDYVAFHALQSFTVQILGTVGALGLLVIGGLVWSVGMVIALLTMIILIGFILVPLWGLVGLALVVGVFLLPVAMTLAGTIAAIETYNGRDYRFPRVANWIDRQMAGRIYQA